MSFKTPFVILAFASFCLLVRGLATVPRNRLGLRDEQGRGPCLPFEKHEHGRCVPTRKPLGADCTNNSDCQSQKCWPQFWYYGPNICSPSPAGVPCRSDSTCISSMYQHIIHTYPTSLSHDSMKTIAQSGEYATRILGPLTVYTVLMGLFATRTQIVTAVR